MRHHTPRGSENDLKILLIEDDEDVAANVAEYLEPRGIELDFAYEGHQGLDLALRGEYSLVLLDLMLPGLDGIELCQRIRAAEITVPIVMLTARDELAKKVLGFESGADDYVVKPFALPELYHRILALLRRSSETSKRRTLKVYDLEIDLETPQVRRAGVPLTLNRTEQKILETLAQAAPTMVTREELENAVWGDDLVRRDLLRSYVYRIRRVIDKPFSEPLLHTVHGRGYALRREGE